MKTESSTSAVPVLQRPAASLIYEGLFAADAVQTALASHDEVSLNKYGRLLEPILQILREEHPETARNRERHQ